MYDCVWDNEHCPCAVTNGLSRLTVFVRVADAGVGAAGDIFGANASTQHVEGALVADQGLH